MPEEIKSCHDCNCEEGELHQLGCDMERCPSCGRQLITCGHFDAVEKQRYSYQRIPYIRYPNICRYCGELWPQMFNVSDEEWRKYVEPSIRGEMLCRRCYSDIKNLIDKKGQNDLLP